MPGISEDSFHFPFTDDNILITFMPDLINIFIGSPVGLQGIPMNAG